MHDVALSVVRYALGMAKPKPQEPLGEYRLPTAAVIWLGIAGILIAMVCGLLAYTGFIATLLAFFFGLFGLGLLIAGIVRAVGDSSEKQRLNTAAHATIASAGAGGTSISAELERLATLHASGRLTDSEYASAKAKVLG